MDHTSEHKPENHICAALLAHVDAGKTTLAEGLLYLSGEIRKLGRVDHKDAFLDTYEMERERGITIFSKQAQLRFTDREGTTHNLTLLDTPGHVDFSAEMERTLQVLDYGILVISAADGVQGHVQTLWGLLKRYRVPVFLFVNKMDQEGADRDALLAELKKRLDDRCVDFSGAGSAKDTDFYDNAAMCSETLMEEFLETETLSAESLRRAVSERELFPCYFGSALKMEGVQEFLESFFYYTKMPVYGEDFGARVFKIGRDKQGKRLTYLKVTGGVLLPRMVLTGSAALGTAVGSSTGSEMQPGDHTGGLQKDWAEKIDQIRLYSGAQFQPVQEAKAGCVCAVTGLSHTYCGQGLGCEQDGEEPVLEPVLTYQIILPPGCDVHRMFMQLAELEEEEPQLHLVWREAVNEIHAQVMGEVQIEILKRLIWERFHVEAEFGSGSIVYKETIAASAEGVGHFEPLHHYAEVHLLLEPGEQGSGLQFDTACSSDMLAVNWQRLVLTHLQERAHKGVLTGSDITDMKITLVAGRAHLKHTEGGDFRQATYRAVRQGLKMAESVLLEPVYHFLLEVPVSSVGRAMTDLERMGARFEAPWTEGEMSLIRGSAPAAAMQGYPVEVASYSGGRGRLSCSFGGYEPCRNAEEVIESIGYDAEEDLANPTGSVFCAHGAGFVVPWDMVYDHMHVPLGAGIIRKEEAAQIQEAAFAKQAQEQARRNEQKEEQKREQGGYAGEAELKAIFERTYGVVKQERKRYGHSRSSQRAQRTGESWAKPDTYSSQTIDVSSSKKMLDYIGQKTNNPSGKNKNRAQKEYLLVDGYNIIFSWDELRELAEENAESARTKLMDVLCNYQGYRQCTVILVFDAYRVEGNPGETMRYHNIHLVYTKEAETADQYIEKTVHEIGRRHQVTVATSDALEQVIIWGEGAKRLSAAGLLEEIKEMEEELRREHLSKTAEKDKLYLFDQLPEELAKEMEQVRLGKKEFGRDETENK